MEGITELAHHQQLIPFVQGGDGHAAGVVDDFPNAVVSVREADLIDFQVDDATLKNVLAAQAFFVQVHEMVVSSFLCGIWAGQEGLPSRK